MKENHFIKWNSIAESRGAHEPGLRQVETDALRGFALDYFLADLCKLPKVELRYLSPDFRIAEVWAEDLQRPQLGLHRWSPSNDLELAERVAVKLANALAAFNPPDLIERMRAMVRQEFGQTVLLPFPVLKTS